MNMMRAIGAPFQIRHSSCFTHKPERFEWTDQPGSWPSVVIDNAIPQMMDGVPNKYAWVCESRVFSCDVRSLLQNPLFEKSYKAIFVSDRSLLPLSPKFKFCLAGSNLPWVKHQSRQPEKTKLCSMIASPKQGCAGHRYRHKVAEKYQNDIDLVGGACGSPRIGFDSRSIDGHPDKSPALYPYMFSIAMENDVYSDYFTEKITDCFASWTIPVYWGNPNIGKHFDTDGIICLDDEFDISMLTKELYESKLQAVKRNNRRTYGMMSADDMLYSLIQREER
tara:strand:+ start:1036 stop:1872 length:837 start_codon:yes stop_codon:yes gene_type:complete